MALSDIVSGAGLIGTALGVYDLSEGAVSDVKRMGTELGARAPSIGQEAASAAEFQPFTVTTGLGTTQVTPEGGYTQALTPEGQQIQEGLLGGVTEAMGDIQVTPESLFEQLQQARQPGIDRQRLALENRLAAQGRLGTSSTMYGGATPEQLALEQSLREQESRDMLTALTQAGALTGQNIQNLTGMLGAAYTPQTQALNALTPAVQLANIAQSARLGGSEALYKGGIAGLETEAAGITGAATLESARIRALADALGMAFGAGMGQDGEYKVPTWLQDLLD